MPKLLKLFLLFFSLALVGDYLARSFPPVNVNIVPATIRSLAPFAWVSGTVVSRNNSELSVEISGRLISLSEVGAEIKKGEMIARIDDKLLRVAYQKNTAQLKSAQSRLSFQQSEVRRLIRLAKANLSSKQQLDEAVSQRDVAQGELAVAQAELAQSKENLLYSTLNAPFDGIVSKRLSNLGEYVTKGNAIVVFVETDNLEASLFAPLTSYQYLKQGMSLAVESPFGKGVATIKVLVPVADKRSHLMEVRLDMSEFDWPVGLNMKAAVANGDVRQVLAVPRDSLVLRRDGISLFIITEDSIAEQVSVNIGIGAGDYVEVIGEISVGDQIVIRGAERLRMGQKVKIKQNNQSLVSGKTQ